MRTVRVTRWNVAMYGQEYIGLFINIQSGNIVGVYATKSDAKKGK